MCALMRRSQIYPHKPYTARLVKIYSRTFSGIIIIIIISDEMKYKILHYNLTTTG